MKIWEDYVLDNGVLKNKFGISNREELYKIETKIVTEKLSLLILDSYVGTFNAARLKAIHRFLFEEIYEFAGEYREVDLYKKYTKFEDFDKIDSHLNDLLDRVNNQISNNLINVHNKFDIARFLGDMYYEFIMIHPFREGNGRAIREFVREFVKYKISEYELFYSKISQENFLIGIIEHDTYPLLLAYEFNNALETKFVKSKEK